MFPKHSFGPGTHLSSFVKIIQNCYICPGQVDTKTDTHDNMDRLYHYNDVIMSAMASQITSVSIVCSTVGSGADQRKYQSSAKMFLFMTSSLANFNRLTKARVKQEDHYRLDKDRHTLNQRNMAQWRHVTSLILVIIGSGNGLLLVWC